MTDYVRAFAAPVAWRGALADRETARARIAALYAAKSAAELAPVFGWFSTIGNRRDYSSYEAHAGGAWKPEPRDRYVFRKAAFTIEHRPRMKGKGLVALDAMRASALAGWAVTAGFLDEPRATASIAPIVTLALETHGSWADFAEQLLLGLEFAEGQVEPSLRAAILALEGQSLAWPEPSAIPAVVSDVDGEGAPLGGAMVLAMKLAVDCPGCEHALPFGDVVETASCRLCGTAVALAADEWEYFFANDAKYRKMDMGEDDPITNDFGDRFFSRRITTKVAAPACPCGAPFDVTSLAPGVLACACGRRSQVRAADARAKAIDEKARFVVAPLPRPIDPAAAFACAACGAEQPLRDDPARVRTCTACEALTFVDDAAHARSFDPPRRATFYVVVGT